MRIATRVLLLTATAVLFPGCVTPPLVIPAPGSTMVRLTQSPADVAQCHPVGNVHVTARATPTVDDAVTELRNQALGLGADSVFITSTDEATFAGGVAYRCHEPVTPLR
jgi:hypothetical protein